jgi:hypothetical protein
MAITAADIKWYYSQQGGEDYNGSLGGAIGTTELTAGDNNLFDDVTGAEASAGDTEYRCFYIKNTHGTLTLSSTYLWIQTETASTDDSVDIGLDLAGKNGTADTVADEDTAPSPAVSFSHPTTKGAGLSLGDLAPGDYYAIWVKRIVTAAASAYSANTGTFRVEGDTPA